MTDFIEFIWGNKIYQIENIDIEFNFSPIQKYPQSISIKLKSNELIRELRELKLKRIIENVSENISPIISKSPIYYCLYNREGFLIRKLLMKPKDVVIVNKIVYIISDFWTEGYV